MSKYWEVEGRVALMTQLVKEGLAYSDVAVRLGDGCTENMICAKVWRMGIGRGSSTATRIYRTKRRGVMRVSPVALAAEMERGRQALALMEKEASLRDDFVSIADLDVEARSCRHIAGEPVGDVKYCGHPAVMGLSWCEVHAKRCLGGGASANAGAVLSLPDPVRELCAA